MPRVKELLVIGAGRGLGYALAEAALSPAGAASQHPEGWDFAAASNGVRVTAIAHERSPLLDRLAAQHAGRLNAQYADVRSDSELERLDIPSDTLFDVVIYNAAVHLEHDARDIEEASSRDVLETLNVNAVGAVRAAKRFRRHLAPGGLLVLVSSEAGSIADAWRSSEYGYCMSKAALNMLARLLGIREKKLDSKIQVIALHPGWMRTRMGGRAADISAEEAARDILATLEARLRGAAGPPFVDRLGKALAW